jgi:hypothetical protein
MNDHTCGAGGPTPSNCMVMSNGQFTDTLFAGCTPVGGSCGYDVLNQIIYCRSLAVPKPIESLNEQVHADQITVNGNSTSLEGTYICPSTRRNGDQHFALGAGRDKRNHSAIAARQESSLRDDTFLFESLMRSLSEP